jgi:pentatricopeptide repeat protein
MSTISSALMEGHVLAGDLMAPKTVMEAAIEVGVKINAVMFTILIVGHARNGDPDAALRNFPDMVNAGVEAGFPRPSIAVASAYFSIGSIPKG